ncbi:tetratricopeptide repeat protein [Prochlorococcus marinus]|uniref:tetratricopeptide repeat protein n=1 Tax=Prochlorococcus marinus TaxID=1219 RepID=UPI0022B2FA37|nr:tetratricopeptide repeat protein [Prochlorococcus marinus]
MGNIFISVIFFISSLITKKQKDSDAYFNRANVKKEIGDINGACEDWRKALDLGDKEAAKPMQGNCE